MTFFLQFTLFFSIVGSDFIANLIPGPNALLVLKNSLHSKTAGYVTVFGMSIANLLHFILSITVLRITQTLSPTLTGILKILAFSYLVYLAYKCLTAKNSEVDLDIKEEPIETKASFLTPVLQALLVSFTNPKVYIYFSTIGMVLMSHNPSNFFLFIVLLGILLSVVLSYGLIAYLSNTYSFKSFINKNNILFERFIGVCFLICAFLVF